MLIGRMRVFVRQTKSKKDRVDPKNFLELDDDGDRSTISLIERLPPKRLVQCSDRGPDSWTLDRSNGRLSTM